MINHKAIRETIAEGLAAYCGCKVIMANQTAEAPKRPYISFTITTAMVANNGTYGVHKDGTERKPVKQIWSFTVQSESSDEAQELANMAYDWFDNLGTEYLNERDVIVETLTNITNRDNLLTSMYEYRCGFDVTFTFMNVVTPNRDVIETAEIKRID